MDQSCNPQQCGSQFRLMYAVYSINVSVLNIDDQKQELHCKHRKSHLVMLIRVGLPLESYECLNGIRLKNGQLFGTVFEEAAHQSAVIFIGVDRGEEVESEFYGELNSLFLLTLLLGCFLVHSE